MSRSSTLILLGILVILAPYSGLPVAFRTLLEVFFGSCVFGIGLAMRTHNKSESSVISNSNQAVDQAPQPPAPPSAPSAI